MKLKAVPAKPAAAVLDGGKPIYARLEDLTEEDIRWNVNRLRNEAESKIKHAHALEEWALAQGIDLSSRPAERGGDEGKI